MKCASSKEGPRQRQRMVPAAPPGAGAGYDNDEEETLGTIEHGRTLYLATYARDPRPDAASFEPGVELRPAKAHRIADAAADTEAGKLAALEPVEHGGGGESEQAGDLASREERLRSHGPSAHS
jgi:hypothetical protein